MAKPSKLQAPKQALKPNYKKVQPMRNTGGDSARDNAMKVAKKILSKKGGYKSSYNEDDNEESEGTKRQRREMVSVQASHNDDEENDEDFDDLSDDDDEEDDDDEDDEDESGEDLDDDETATTSHIHAKSLAAAMSSQSGRKSLLVKHIQEQLEQELAAEDVENDSGEDQEDLLEEDEQEDQSREAANSVTDANTSTTVSAPKYKQRVLLVASRGITYRYRHLMNELHMLLPHSKKDAKLDSKSHLEDLNELAELNNCNNCLYFEVRRHQDMYLWMAKTPNGPSVKFMVRNVHTMDELKMTGNCLKGSRPVLSFDKSFDMQPHLQLLKEMFTQTFAVPRTSRKIKPFIDHVMSFSIVDNKIWLRNFQIIEKAAEKGVTEQEMSLVEIGPRCVLDLVRIFDGSFGGSTLYENASFVSPNDIRRSVKAKLTSQYRARTTANDERDRKKIHNMPAPDPLADVFV
ncbi:hypothetical protein BASA50_005792 [Batrachochytrium salamandrivorans]|uniref:Brix domain-containing protein n=1 Tax=Batrachochytrium salamandrivorans TaxID=1357716 RepID=A0ABQ8FBS0_9FUNG|nr:hypothetical protein BASA50_005792 [Batrachochytrium salamandrivorans]